MEGTNTNTTNLYRLLGGIKLNDVFIVGDFGLVVHFNGSSWITIPEANVALNNFLDYKNNLMVSVGKRNQKGGDFSCKILRIINTKMIQ
ncbi:MAG: hypothetical protein MZV64_61420 [Ignavibacteriales bacterium]|nr:hypothetical protein [Ignavibacteriales bacterium]